MLNLPIVAWGGGGGGCTQSTGKWSLAPGYFEVKIKQWAVGKVRAVKINRNPSCIVAKIERYCEVIIYPRMVQKPSQGLLMYLCERYIYISLC